MSNRNGNLKSYPSTHGCSRCCCWWSFLAGSLGFFQVLVCHAQLGRCAASEGVLGLLEVPEGLAGGKVGQIPIRCPNLGGLEAMTQEFTMSERETGSPELYVL